MKKDYSDLVAAAPYIELPEKSQPSPLTTHLELLTAIYHLNNALTTATKIISNLQHDNTRLLAAHAKNHTVNQKSARQPAKKPDTGSPTNLPDVASRNQTLNAGRWEYGKPFQLSDII